MDAVAGGGEEEKTKKQQTPDGGGVKSKRKMKTASQLEILEKTYAVEMYPSEALRAELSVQLGLSDRQLQMWFCHRRLKDRKPPPAKRPRKDSPAPAIAPVEEEMGAVREVGNDRGLGSSSSMSPFTHRMDPRRFIGRPPGVAVPRISGDAPVMKRYYESQQSIAELRAIAFVELQLGERLREDGPILGMEFDPLPPDAFGVPIGASTVGQQKQPGRLIEANLYERSDLKPIKGTTKALHEYQFIPQQPTVRADACERLTPSYHYSSPADDHNADPTSLSSVRPFMHGNEQVPSGYGFPSRAPGLNLMPQESRQGHLLPSAAEYETVPRRSPFTNISMEAQFGVHPVSALNNTLISSNRRVTHEEDVLRMERKRKSEEARIAREVEAHEKRIQKELEKQDILRRKREEQIRKEMERHDRERRKEEERLLREKQREEERYQREQRRELERKERYLQKESMRAEKMRQKEELRREKEAARQRAAIDRAIARRIAKESMELVEDERLELMEKAASTKRLPSMLSLDFDTLQNLDLFRDKLSVFPPESVVLKRPFAIRPWIDSEENVGNLLMVWRFLITFVDVLGIWPFTLDEFVQAFHDYDPRLLSEIHIALLKSIIKDIEDVARTPATGLGANQNSAANPGGGHLEIVEGAYAWGFDIRSWQHHLNPLTWPEILREFALSAGFGPKLRKRNADQAYLRDDSEGIDGEDAITNLRSGAAVENAVAIMQERGFSNPRRSRHRLTPGTVKYAAFHVLSLEGSKGLTILEVAEKIQKSGLRDLTTSKTPEASIAAALSRDSKLFERTAPSTYCVRSAYRKGPADAEAILSVARERIKIFKSGSVNGEDADDAERDEDSESDVADDPEVDDLGTDLNPKKEVQSSPQANKFNGKTLTGNGKENDDIVETPQTGIKNVGEDFSSVLPKGINRGKGVGAFIDQSVDVTGISANHLPEDAVIDESNPGEPWVQGLMEGEYSDLSVEERLNALVSLIGIAIEGNSIRVVLEERLEAANALKKQMWAEAQLDKRRMKEEYVVRTCYSSFTGNKLEPNLAMSAAEDKQSLLVTDNKTINMSVNAAVQQEQVYDLQNDLNYLNNMSSEGIPQIHDFSAGPDNLPYQQLGHAVEKSRSQLKSYIGHKAEGMYVYRSLPLGQDRRRNRYWQFITSASCNDPSSGRIFVELRDGCWRLIDSEEGFDILLASLDVRGIRESHLHTMLQKIEISFKETVRRNILCANLERQIGPSVKREPAELAVGIDSPNSTICFADSDVSETSTSFTIELGRNETEKNHALKRYQDSETWMWKECFNSSVLSAMKYGKKRCTQLLSVCDYCHDVYFSEDSHCFACHKTFDAFGSDLNFSEHVACCEEKLKIGPASALLGPSSPLRIRLLKLQLALIEVSVLPEALQAVWTNGYRRSWGLKLKAASSAAELLQLLTLLEGVIKRDYLSSIFETTGELLGSSEPSGYATNDSFDAETVSTLPWLPQTTAAIALRLMEFDSSISYMLHRKVEFQKDKVAGDLIKVPSKYGVVKNTNVNETTGTQHQGGFFQENWLDMGTGLVGLGDTLANRGRAHGRTRGGRSQRRATGSRSVSAKRSMTSSNDRLGHVLTWKGRPRAQRGHVLTWKGRRRAQGGRKRGCRSTRNRQKVVKTSVESVAERDIPKETIYKKLPRGQVREDWNGAELRFQEEGGENGSSSERSDCDHENGHATGDEYDDMGVDEYAGGFNGKSGDLLGGSDYNVDANEEDDGLDEDEDEDEQADLDVDEYINRDSDEDIRAEDISGRNGQQNGDPDEGMGSSSSDFSD